MYWDNVDSILQNSEQKFWLYALWDESIHFLSCLGEVFIPSECSMCIETSSTDWESCSQKNIKHLSLILFPSLRLKKPNFHCHPRRSLCLSLDLFITKRKALDPAWCFDSSYTERCLRYMFFDCAACSGSKAGTFAIAEGKMEHVCSITK